MKNWVIFFVSKGKGKIFIDKKSYDFSENNIYYTKPATISIYAKTALHAIGVIVK